MNMPHWDYELKRVKFNKNYVTRWVKGKRWLRVKGGIDDLLNKQSFDGVM